MVELVMSSNTNESVQQELIRYMFRRDANGQYDAMACLKLWFGKSHDTDNEIRHRFGDYVQRAIAGALDHWMETPHGCFALMILLDHFPRNKDDRRNSVPKMLGNKGFYLRSLTNCPVPPSCWGFKPLSFGE